MFKNITYICIALIVLVYPQFELAYEVYYGTHGEKPRGLSILICLLPCVNIMAMNKWMGTSNIVTGIIYAISAAAIVLRATVIAGINRVPMLMIASVWGALATMALIWIAASICFFNIGRCADCSKGSLFVCLLLPPIGAFLISNRVRVPLNKVRTELR